MRIVRGRTGLKSEVSAHSVPPGASSETLNARSFTKVALLGRERVTATVTALGSAAVFWEPSSAPSVSTRR